MQIKKVLTIAGSDSSGGAGIQADIKTIMANGCYAMSAITSLTAQNTIGVTGIMDTTPEFLELQIRAVFDDIRPDAVKIGMVSSKELICTIADMLTEYEAQNIVLDPVMVSTSGSRLLKDDAVFALCDRLFPIADIITPNIPEASLLTGLDIKCEEDMSEAGRMLADKYNINVLIKGGHSINDANDMLVTKDNCVWFRGEHIDNQNTHGTGCTLSSAIASYLANGYNMADSVKKAKQYISDVLKHEINLGAGSGPLNHGWRYEND